MDRDLTLLAKIGLGLVQVQRVERTLSACIAAAPGLAGIRLSPEDFLSVDPKRRKHTLGQLLRPIRESLPLGEFDAWLAKFLEKRNDFAHNYWAQRSQAWPLDDVAYAEAGTYVDELIAEAGQLERVFRGLFGVIILATAEKQGANLAVTHPGLLPMVGERAHFYSAIGVEQRDA